MFRSNAHDKEKKGQEKSFSWQPDGCCAGFTKKAILASAPRASGVYGLHNVDCQIFIGESENIQEALLRHEKETDFTSRHLVPVGFAFELCTAELRKSKVAELIRRFCPVLQANASLDQSLVNEPKERPQGHPQGQFKRRRRSTFAASLIAGAMAVLYPGIPAINDIQSQVYSAVGNPLGRILVANSKATDENGMALTSPSGSAIKAVSGLENQNAEPMQVKPNDYSFTREPSRRFEAESATREDKTAVLALSAVTKTSLNADAEDRANLRKKWSVQVSAEPTKAFADTLVQRLKNDGYDSYAVQAVVKGQTYYRVRVGRLDSQKEAESVRQSLTRQESFRNAYLTAD